MALLIEINGFGKWLKEKREARGLSMRALADKAENVCSPSYIAQLETNYYVGRKGTPMQPSEEIVEKLAKALDESVNEARIAANYPSLEENPEENTKFNLSNILQKMDSLPLKSKQFAIRHFEETINFLLELDGASLKGVLRENNENLQVFENTSKPREKPETVPDAEIKRLGIKPLKVGKIKKEAQ